MDYILKSKDKPILLFSVNKNIEEINNIEDITYSLEIKKIENRSLLPIALEPTENSLSEWLRNRKIPNNREHVEQLLNMFSNVENPYNYIDVTYALSLNDTYWVCPANQDIKWKDINLYDNRFNEVIAQIAFTGFSLEGNMPGKITSPEFTTNGMLKKCWHREDGVIYLLKGSTARYANGGQEAVLEVYASQIAKKMGLPHITYAITEYKGELVSSCKIFTSEDIGYIPMAALVKDMKLTMDDLPLYKTQLEIAERYGIKEFQDMMVFDALIHNKDRHLGNFGVLVNNDTNEVIGPAPLFDHGNSLFYRAVDENYDDLEQYSKNATSYWGISFDRQAQLYLQKRHEPLLRKLSNFKFNRVQSTIVDEKKVNALETYIKNRASQFIKIIHKKERKKNIARH